MKAAKTRSHAVLSRWKHRQDNAPAAPSLAGSERSLEQIIDDARLIPKSTVRQFKVVRWVR